MLGARGRETGPVRRPREFTPYDKPQSLSCRSRYTGDELKQLIGLYESPLGHKMRRSSDLIELEATHRGESLCQELIRRIQEQLRPKGYKLPAA